MYSRIIKKIIASACVLFPFHSRALVKLPPVFTSNMVLQQKTNAAIRGTAVPYKTVTVTTSWNGARYQTRAGITGDWKLKVATPSYGGPYTIDIAEDNHIQLVNVLIGDVWLCSGQSNMEMPLAGWGKINNYRKEIANANYPAIRLLHSLHTTSNTPAKDVQVRNNGWDVCSPNTIAEFSAVAYFFARTIYEKTKIPIGLIHSSWGGTVAEAWTSYGTLSTLADFARVADSIRNAPAPPAGAYQQLFNNWFEGLDQYDKGLENGNPVWAKQVANPATWSKIQLPGPWELSVLPDFDGGVWIKKTIHLPAGWKKADALLQLGTVDEYDETFFNGEKLGETNGTTRERKYSIPRQFIREGDNDLTVRIKDSKGYGGLRSDPDRVFIKGADGDSINLSGDWLYKVSFSIKNVPPPPVDPDHPNRPTVLYNAMIHPIIDYAIKGVIWYQGESNAARALQYRTLFPALINDWRSRFSMPDLPFYFAQLASYRKKNNQPSNSYWSELREAQLLTTQLPHTGMATTIDIGDSMDVHPKNKQEVGRRLALIALHHNYGQPVEYSGPRFLSMQRKAGELVLQFDHAKGMHPANGPLQGFAIAGEDQRFYWANARVEGNSIVVSSPAVKTPVAVRYAWADNPDANLVNSDGLPASPFRSDNWR